MGRPKVVHNKAAQEHFKFLLKREELTQTRAAEIFSSTQQTISGIVNGRHNLSEAMIDAILTAYPEYNRDWLRGDPGVTMLKPQPIPEDTFFSSPAISAIIQVLGTNDFDYWKIDGDETTLEIKTKDGDLVGSVTLEQAQDLQRTIDDFRDLLLIRIKGGK